jgi:hypothetical protein
MGARGTHGPEGAPLHRTSILGQRASPLRVRPTADGNFPLGVTDGIADVANRVNQGRLTELFPEPPNEHLNQFGIVFVRVLPEPNIYCRSYTSTRATPVVLLTPRTIAV